MNPRALVPTLLRSREGAEEATVERIKLDQVERAFVGWRAKKNFREHLPEALWAKAVRAAREHGTTRTARLLRLNHSALKRRVVERYGPPAEPAQTFVELPAISGAGPHVQQEATVEVEDAAGFRLRLVLRGLGPQEVAAAARELWSARA